LEFDVTVTVVVDPILYVHQVRPHENPQTNGTHDFFFFVTLEQKPSPLLLLLTLILFLNFSCFEQWITIIRI